jgi:hypothetical protein
MRAPAPELRTGTVAARCGCEGTVLSDNRGPFPFVSALITVPCRTGHPGRVAAGVIERFNPDDVSPAAGPADG